MKFKYHPIAVSSSEAFPKRTRLFRPIIPVSLINGGHRLRYEALIDSGADYTVFPLALGIMLGLNREKGKRESILGVSGVAIDVYFYHISTEIGGLNIKIYAGFAEAMNQDPGILGQKGFFDKFVVKFDLIKKAIELKPKLKVYLTSSIVPTM